VVVRQNPSHTAVIASRDIFSVISHGNGGYEW
jgi:hypothetical protein